MMYYTYIHDNDVYELLRKQERLCETMMRVANQITCSLLSRRTSSNGPQTLWRFYCSTLSIVESLSLPRVRFECPLYSEPPGCYFKTTY